MSTSFHEHEMEMELEGLGELEGEHEHEHEHEGEHEHEHEQFFGGLAKLAARAFRSPALRRIASQAARSALQSLAPQGEHEHELEGEHEHELEGELNPVRKVYTDAMMEHMAHIAAESESEHEAAEALLPLIPMVASKLVPLAMRALPRLGARVAPRLVSRVMRVAPQLTRGIGQVTRTLHRNPRTRPLIRMLPTIARRTTAQLLRGVARGRRISPAYAVRTLAQQTARVLGSPRRCMHAWHGARRLDRRYHRANPGTPCPGCRRRRRRRYNGLPAGGGSMGRAASSTSSGSAASCVRCC
jgi:hypothetical protein